jgi:hypothetical protein
MKACILNSATKVCENIIELDPEDFESFVPYKEGIELATDHTGHIGWTWNPTSSQWIEPNIILTIEEKAARVRWKRKQLLKRYVDSMNPIRWSLLSAEKQTELEVYRQALLDITGQPEFPDTVEWPPVPNL